MSQTESTSPTTPFVISASDPFVALSQAVKDGSSLFVTPSSILSSAGPGNFLTIILSSTKTFVTVPTSFLRFLLRGLYCDLYSFLGPSLTEVTSPSRFEIGSSSATVPNPVSEAAAFFAHFEQVETNDFDLADFWCVESPYVDFHNFWVPKECVAHLEADYNSHGDFIQGFPFSHSTREHFLKLLGCVINDVENNFMCGFC